LKSFFMVLVSSVFLLANGQATAQTRNNYAEVGLSPTSGVVRGISQCRSDLGLAFAASGLVAKTFVEEGQEVQAGDVLLQLNQGVEEIDLRRRELIWQSGSELEAATARLEVAETQWQAAQRIYDSSRGVSREELQNRQLAFAVATSEVNRLNTQKQMEHLDFLTAQENLNQRTLLAPTVGIVSSLIRKTGESAQANDPVLQLCDLSKINFVANVPVALAETLTTSQTIKLNFPGHSETLNGQVVFVSPVVDSASGLRELKVEITDSPGWLRPGLSADFAIDQL
jgi:RND family efflux transporter MFP subunit